MIYCSLPITRIIFKIVLPNSSHLVSLHVDFNKLSKNLRWCKNSKQTSNRDIRVSAKPGQISTIVHFTVSCLVAKPLNRSQGKGDHVMTQMLVLFICKLLCYHARLDSGLYPNITFSVTQNQRLGTKYTNVKWHITSMNQLEFAPTEDCFMPNQVLLCQLEPKKV